MLDFSLDFFERFWLTSINPSNNYIQYSLLRGQMIIKIALNISGDPMWKNLVDNNQHNLCMIERKIEKCVFMYEKESVYYEFI